ncbi:hypothetical protein AB1484_31920 [Parafrankia sp. FMc6]|uniref:glycine-rich domain-containing protein n=1 Tax=Parafrankia soli TaxID=2599596 RepID=UPI0034D602D1
MTAVAEAPTMTGRFLVRPALFDWLVDRVSTDDAVVGDRALAARIVDQALAFLAASGTSPHTLVPSRLVDVGWHAFLLHTREYAAYCDQIAGRFIHHTPAGTADEPVDAASARDRTLTAITEAGYAVDADLWPEMVSADCSDEGNCSASGKDGNENKDTRIPN